MEPKIPKVGIGDAPPRQTGNMGMKFPATRRRKFGFVIGGPVYTKY